MNVKRFAAAALTALLLLSLLPTAALAETDALTLPPPPATGDPAPLPSADPAEEACDPELITVVDADEDIVVITPPADEITLVDEAGGTSLADWIYSLDDEAGTVILTKYQGAGGAVTVPGSFEIEGRRYAVLLCSSTVFRANTSLTSVTLESGVGFVGRSMRLLFGECSALTEVDLSAVDSSEITDMSYMFYQCGAIRSLDLSALDTSRVISMRAMFYYCSKLSDLRGYENWDTGCLEDLYMTFCRVAFSVSASTQVRIDLSRWDLDQVKNTGWCFQQCRAQEILLPDGLAVISAGFMNHAVRYAGSSYTVPAGVKKIGYAHTFYDFATNDFVEFRVAEGNTAYQAIDGVLYSADGTELLAVPRNKPFDGGVFEVPEGVSYFGELSFSRNYNIHTLVLPDSYEIEYVPIYDPRYIVYDDTGNLNAGTNLSIAIYCYTGVNAYAVKDSNPRYASLDGVIYSKDMSSLVAVPARYAQTLAVPEGVTDWEREAMWADGSATVDNLLANCPGVSLPSTLTHISEDQLAMLNRLHQNRADSDKPFTITLAEGNPVFRLDADGCLCQPITVTQQPEDVNVPLGAVARTTVAAEGEGLCYQWYGINPDGQEFVSSLHGRSYSFTMVTAKIGRQVWCVITDANGNSVTTRTATLGVTLPDGYTEPSITRDAEHCLVEPGGKATVSIEAEGCGSLRYQWYYRNRGDGGWSRSSLKTDTYSCAMNDERDGRQVYCVVTDAYGHTARSRTVTVGYSYPAGYTRPRVTVQPESVWVEIGETARVSFEAEGTGLSYQWYLRDPGRQSWSRSSLTGSSYAVTMVPAKSGREVKCVIKDPYGNSTETAVVTLNMAIPTDYAPPRIEVQPADASAPRGQKASTTVIAEGTGLTYQWYLRDPGKQSWSRSSLRTDTYSVAMVPSKSGREVYCVITDKYGASVTSEIATLTMEP